MNGPGLVEKVGEVTGYGTISYTHQGLTLYRERKCPTWPTSVTFATRDVVGLLSRGSHSPQRTGIVNVNVEPTPT
jgi:hypothetical protein